MEGIMSMKLVYSNIIPKDGQFVSLWRDSNGVLRAESARKNPLPRHGYTYEVLDHDSDEWEPVFCYDDDGDQDVVYVQVDRGEEYKNQLLKSMKTLLDSDDPEFLEDLDDLLKAHLEE
jgi:hypothetical protein